MVSITDNVWRQKCSGKRTSSRKASDGIRLHFNIVQDVMKKLPLEDDLFRFLQPDGELRSRIQWGGAFVPRSTQICQNIQLRGTVPEPEFPVDAGDSAALNVEKYTQQSRKIMETELIEIRKQVTGLEEKMKSHMKAFKAIPDVFIRILASIFKILEEKERFYYLLCNSNAVYDIKFSSCYFPVCNSLKKWIFFSGMSEF